MNRLAALLAAVSTAGLVTVAAACTGADQGGLRDTEQVTSPGGADGGSTGAANLAPPSDPGVDSGPQPTLGGAVRQADQFKSSAQLRAAISACFGAGVTTVTASMLQTTGGASVTGFLSPTDFAAGDDVIAQQALIFDGDPAVARTGVRNDTVSLPLLAALQNVGNVVGGNCAAQLGADGGTNPAPADGGVSACACSTHDTALAMLARCLPSVDPSAYAAVVDGFAAACATDDAAAVASLVASTTFGAQ